MSNYIEQSIAPRS